MNQPDGDFIALQVALSGEYSLDRELGRGGMGVVYLAREVRLARAVAIKVLPRDLAAAADRREAFLRESRTVGGLNHPNIVPVYAAGERDGFVYIVMAYVEGMTLGERIRSRGPLLPGQAARVLREVAWALAYAHSAGIVHRDVSAENILLERGSERAIVTDFGIASAMATAALDDEGRVMGNAHYLSPEHAAGEPLDARSDLYSLGVVGYYALTGRLPFDGETSADVVAQHLNAVAPSITSVAASVPPRLAAAVERCLHKDPARRYNSAESFAEAIDLAFEHAKEIPAPLRSWINQGERELPARLAMLGMGTMTGITLAFASGIYSTFLIPFVFLGGLSLIPAHMRLRRILGDGYHVDDLSAALREHQLVRAEEIEYERRLGSPRVRSWLRVLLGVSTGTTGIAAYGAWRFLNVGIRSVTVMLGTYESMQYWWMGLLFLGGAGLAISGVPLAGEFIRHRLSSRIAASSITFWKGKWGTRIAKLTSIGLKPAERPMLGGIEAEIALGRATEHLFHALPKIARRELASLPETVRRLEGDASRLRASITALDDQLAAFDRGSESLDDDQRTDIERQVREARALSAERLSATVVALESIRLDLLRLQLGRAQIASVTATLEAAREIGDRIGDSIAAQLEVEQLLLASRTGALPRATRAEEEPRDGEDADTPIDGVPVAHA
jgi:tRNA A-37 threonylcarbamoyl transferase component Bud32